MRHRSVLASTALLTALVAVGAAHALPFFGPKAPAQPRDAPPSAVLFSREGYLCTHVARLILAAKLDGRDAYQKLDQQGDEYDTDIGPIVEPDPVNPTERESAFFGAMPQFQNARAYVLAVGGAKRLVIVSDWAGQPHGTTDLWIFKPSIDFNTIEMTKTASGAISAGAVDLMVHFSGAAYPGVAYKTMTAYHFNETRKTAGPSAKGAKPGAMDLMIGRSMQRPISFNGLTYFIAGGVDGQPYVVYGIGPNLTFTDECLIDYNSPVG